MIQGFEYTKKIKVGNPEMCMRIFLLDFKYVQLLNFEAHVKELGSQIHFTYFPSSCCQILSSHCYFGKLTSTICNIQFAKLQSP
jgi:hypothetical protein